MENEDSTAPDDSPQAAPSHFALDLTDAQMEGLARTCANNVFAVMVGRTPSYYMPEFPDGNVTGVAMLVADPDGEEVLEVNKLEVAAEMPLQATLFALAHTAAGVLLARRSGGLYGLESLNLALGILCEPTPCGTAAAPELVDVDPKRHALGVIEGKNSCWVFNPEKTPEELLAEASEEAHVQERDATGGFRFAIRTTEDTMTAAWLPDEPLPPPPSAPPPAVD